MFLLEIQYPAGRRGNAAEFKTGHPPPHPFFSQSDKEPEGAMKKYACEDTKPTPPPAPHSGAAHSEFLHVRLVTLFL